MNKAYIIDASGRLSANMGGGLSSIRPDDLLAHVVRQLLTRNPGIDLAAIEDLIAGDANQAGEDNRDVARMAALLAGLPVSVAGSTVTVSAPRGCRRSWMPHARSFAGKANYISPPAWRV